MHGQLSDSNSTCREMRESNQIQGNHETTRALPRNKRGQIVRAYIRLYTSPTAHLAMAHLGQPPKSDRFGNWRPYRVLFLVRVLQEPRVVPCDAAGQGQSRGDTVKPGYVYVASVRLTDFIQSPPVIARSPPWGGHGEACICACAWTWLKYKRGASLTLPWP